jgi:hypothetical protein
MTTRTRRGGGHTTPDLAQSFTIAFDCKSESTAPGDKRRAHDQHRSGRWWTAQYPSVCRGRARSLPCACMVCFGLGDDEDREIAAILHRRSA